MTITGWLRWAVISPLLPDEHCRVLDLGAGTGSVGLLLARRYAYVGIEPDRVSFEEARNRIGSRGTVVNCTFEAFEPEGRFDAVCAFEVLEHIEDDARAIREWVRHLRPGGVLVVSVPAGSTRYGRVNENVGDLRRYERRRLVELFESAGLEDVVTSAYGSPYGNVQESVQNTLLRRRHLTSSAAERTAASARSMHPPASIAWFVRAIALPLVLAQRPFTRRGVGTGLVCRGRTPDSPP